jgi:ATP-dependent DNA ligase
MRFIRPIHPKTSILPTREAIAKVLSNGWVAQAKINGRRNQLHVGSDGSLRAFTRQGTPHTLMMPKGLKDDLIDVLRPAEGTNVVDSEWYTQTNEVFTFDMLAKDGVVLQSLRYDERHALLPATAGRVHLLPFLDLEQAVTLIETGDEVIEGIVLKSPSSTGFSDTSVIRCRRSGVDFLNTKERFLKLKG